MATIQEDYVLARVAATQYDREKSEDPLYLNRLNLQRFRNEGVTSEEISRIVKTHENYFASLANALEQMLKDVDEGLLN